MSARRAARRPASRVQLPQGRNDDAQRCDGVWIAHGARRPYSKAGPALCKSERIVASWRSAAKRSRAAGTRLPRPIARGGSCPAGPGCVAVDWLCAPSLEDRCSSLRRSSQGLAAEERAMAFWRKTATPSRSNGSQKEAALGKKQTLLKMQAKAQQGAAFWWLRRGWQAEGEGGAPTIARFFWWCCCCRPPLESFTSRPLSTHHTTARPSMKTGIRSRCPETRLYPPQTLFPCH